MGGYETESGGKGSRCNPGMAICGWPRSASFNAGSIFISLCGGLYAGELANGGVGGRDVCKTLSDSIGAADSSSGVVGTASSTVGLLG